MDHSKGLPPATTQNPWESVRDPSMVFYKDRWHLFASILKRKGGESGRVRIGYMSFAEWSQAQAQDWHLIELYRPGDYIDYHGAPQIFFFAPQKKRKQRAAIGRFMIHSFRKSGRYSSPPAAPVPRFAFCRSSRSAVLMAR